MCEFQVLCIFNSKICSPLVFGIAELGTSFGFDLHSGNGDLLVYRKLFKFPLSVERLPY